MKGEKRHVKAQTVSAYRMDRCMIKGSSRPFLCMKKPEMLMNIELEIEKAKQWLRERETGTLLMNILHERGEKMFLHL